jgi:hypothetical protein
VDAMTSHYHNGPVPSDDFSHLACQFGSVKRSVSTGASGRVLPARRRDADESGRDDRARIFDCIDSMLAPQRSAELYSISISRNRRSPRRFFNHGWTRINTDDDRVSLIRVHPCSSVVGSFWLRHCRAALYRRLAVGRASDRSHESAVPNGW